MSDEVIVCYERWDMERLREVKAMPNLIKELKQLLDAQTIVLEKDGRLRVHYSTKRGDAHGRMYANLSVRVNDAWISGGLSLAPMKRWVRRYLCQDLYHDFDIVNCAPVLLQQIMERHNLCPPELVRYIERRDAIFAPYLKKGIARSVVKQAFLEVLHNGQGTEWMPETMELRTAIQSGLKKLARMREYALAAHDAETGKANFMGRFCAHIWQVQEQRLLMTMRQYFIQLGYSRYHMVLCFDGLMLEKRGVGECAPINLSFLSDYLHRETGFRVRVEEKALDFDSEDTDDFNKASGL